MTAISWIPPVVNSNDTAKLRAWVADLHAKMLAVGLIQTADAGQLDIPSMVHSTATGNAYYGYLMYRFNDPLQATLPVFIKLELGHSGGAGLKIPTSRVAIGTGTNGSGTLTGVVSQALRIQTTNPTTGSVSEPSPPSYICYNAEKGFFGIVFAPEVYWLTTARATPVAFFISRSHDDSWTPTAEGVTLAGLNVFQTSGTGWNYSSVWNNVPSLYHETLGPSSILGAQAQLCVHWTDTPEIISSQIVVQRSHCRLPLSAPLFGLIAHPHNATFHGSEVAIEQVAGDPTNFVLFGWVAGIRPHAGTISIQDRWSMGMLFE